MTEKMEDAATLYKRVERALYIETVKGNKFYIDDPAFDIEEMAHALAHQCRYTGHTREFYSVAEHSVLVSRIVQVMGLGDPFEGLMHDGAEAYLSDIAAPWKALLPDYKKLEAKIEGPMREWLNLPPTLGNGIKQADWLALFLEAKVLIPSGAKDWVAPDGIVGTAEGIRHHPLLGIHCWNPDAARERFLQRYNELSNART